MVDERADKPQQRQPECHDPAPPTEAIPAPATPPPAAPRRRPAVLVTDAERHGRELVVALGRLGVEVIGADAGQLAATIERLRPAAAVVAGGACVGEAVAAAAERTGTEVAPGGLADGLIADREALRRLAADELGLPTPPFWFAASAAELAAIAEHAGSALVVKPAAASRGQGESVLLCRDDVEPAWRHAVADNSGEQRVLVEALVEVDCEVTLLTVRGAGPRGPALDFCAPIGHRRLGGDAAPVLESWQPQPMSTAALESARSIAARIVNALGGRGLFGVELLVRGDEVYFSDVDARPSDIALITQRTQRLSGFELQARAVLGLGGDTIMISPGAARLVYSGRAGDEPGGAGAQPAAVLAEALQVPESDVVVFEHPGDEPPRRLGVAVATGADVATARDRAGRAATALAALWPA